MASLHLSYHFDTNGRTIRKSKSAPEWEEIENALEYIRIHSGAISLDIINPPDSGPQAIGVQSEPNNYLVTLGEINNGTYEVRTLTNIDSLSGRIEIGGNLWDSQMITTDFGLVIRVIREFFETCNVSHDLLTF